jgi:hypothetical protein
MNLFKKLWDSVRHAADAFQSLGDTAAEANTRMRANLGLDEPETPAAVESNGAQRKRIAAK